MRAPKKSGYRSVHLVYSYQAESDDDPLVDGLAVELQIRTQLQHTWATANEVVGTFLREDLKSGKGNPDWLRFFVLAGAVIGRREGMPFGRHVPQNERTMDQEFRRIRDPVAGQPQTGRRLGAVGDHRLSPRGGGDLADLG